MRGGVSPVPPIWHQRTIAAAMLPSRCSFFSLSFSPLPSLPVPPSLVEMRGKRQSPTGWCVNAEEQAGERARIARWGRNLRAKELTSCAGKRPLSFLGGSEPTRRGGGTTERAQRSRNRRSRRAMACSRDDRDGLW
ncbi:hypothetical protein HDV57DRAFT_33034 [Trichoderma longibrachiatum]